MGVEEHVRALVGAAISELVLEGQLPSEAKAAVFAVERPKRPEHGDFATNAAMTIQKLAKKPPREIATLLSARLSRAKTLTAIEIAGPGFLNFRLAPSAFHVVLDEVLKEGSAYGRARAATGERILLEFVSANPTGPLLISHGRGAILGDAIGSVLEAAGHRIVREYYLNDAGNQVRLLAESVRAASEGLPPPEGGYGGDYVKELADWVRQYSPESLSDSDASVLARTCVSRMVDGVPGSKVLPGIKRTLSELGIHFDVWFSEESLYRWGRVGAALADLERRGMVEEREGALFFKTAEEGDDKDRVVRKRDGHFTYFASDIAYHADKAARGYERLITVLGADHHGYTARLRAGLRAFGFPGERFEVPLYQLVNLLRDGKPVKMGKRLGNLITIEEVVEEIDAAAGRKGAGADALRYFYLSRRSDTTIDLDVELAKKNSMDNPVFYLQYGYARLCSIKRKAEEELGLVPPAFDAALCEAKLTHPDELSMLARLGRFPALLKEAAELREPHRVVFYLQELSQDFQSYWTRLYSEGDSVLPRAQERTEADWQTRWDKDKTLARLAWIEGIRIVYEAGLRLCGITALSRMERRDDKREAADVEAVMI